MTPSSFLSRFALTAAVAAAGTAAAWAQDPFPGGFGGRGPGGGVQEDLALVKTYDKDGNGWLDADERRAAREAIPANGGRGGFGGRGGRGGFGRGGLAPGSPGPTVDPASVTPVSPSVPLYDPKTVRTIFFEFENTDWEEELAAFKDTDVEIPATMTVDGRRYAQVGISFRGNSSFMMVPAGLKRSLNVSIDFVHEDQDLLGFRTLNLMNGVNDPTMMRGVLFEFIANQYIPAARANFVHVVINGESWGVYTNLEQINRDFVEDRFDGRNGARWKVPGSPGSRAGLEYTGDDPEPYKQLFDIRNRDNDESWEALVNLARVLDRTPSDQLETTLPSILDVDETLRFLALDNVLVNSDGYWTRGSDYYLILDTDGRFHVLPGDTNETFSAEGGRGGRGGRRGGGFGPGGAGPGGGPGPGGPAPGAAGPGVGAGGSGPTLDLLVGLGDPTKPLRSKLLAVPAWRAKYLEYCRDIAERWLDWSVMGPVATAYHDLIAPVAAADTRKLVSTEQFENGLEEFRTFIEARRTYVLNYSAP